MEKKRTSQLLTIILCIALVIAVIFAKAFMKEDKKAENKTVALQDDISADSEKNKNNISDSNEKESLDSKNFVGEDSLKNVDTTLYEENTEKEIAPEGVTKILFSFTNGEVLYEKDYPSGIYKNIKEEFQKYINLNIDSPEKITEIKIIEDSIVEEGKKLTFDVDLNNGTLLKVTCDLNTFEYSFKIK